MSAINYVGKVVEFVYNGSFRTVAVEKQGETFLQCRNITEDGCTPKRPYATYSFDKMLGGKLAGVRILAGG